MVYCLPIFVFCVIIVKKEGNEMLKLTEDKLNRLDFIDRLFSLFENFGDQGSRGLTMIINGKYGSGKTTLLSFISEQNDKEKKFDI